MKKAKTALWKDLWREIWSTKSRFLSIFAIVAIGTAFFSGIKVSCYDMKNTAATYFAQQNLFDFKVQTNYGIDENILAELQGLNGVEAVMPGYSADLFAMSGERAVVVRAYSYNAQYTGAQAMNQLVVSEGRMPQNINECVVEQTHYTPENFVIGGEITFFLGEDEDIADTLNTETFKIVGVVRSPQYISLDRGVSAVGDGSVNSFVYLSEGAFSGDVYTEAYIKMQGAEGLSPYENEYETLAAAMETRLENAMERLAVVRHDTIAREAEAEIADAEAEIADARREIADARRELAKAEDELLDAQSALRRAHEQADAAFAKAEKDLADGESQLATLEGYYAAAQTAVAQEGAALAAAEPLASAMRAYMLAGSAEEEQEVVLTQLAPIVAAMGADAAQLEAQLAANKAQGLGLPALPGMVDNEITQGILGAYLTSGGTLVQAANGLVDTLATQIVDAQTQITAGRAQLEKEKVSAYAALAAGDAELADGWQTFYDEQRKALREIADAEKDIAEGEVELADAKETLATLSAGKGYTFDRDLDEGYASFGQDAERVDAVAAVFPVFFILVAALVCLTTMTRMVEDQRTQIGTMKALGYSRASILVKYLVYAGLASVCGSLFGTALGLQILPRVIYNAYSMMYFITDLITPYLFPYFFWCTVVSVLTTCVAAYWACRRELQSQPAQLMRPKAPPNGKRVFLERIGFIWNRLSFSYKVTVRNLMRYKKRVAITVIGIAGCTALMLTGFGLKDSISVVVSKQFDEVFLYDATTIVSDEKTPEETAEARELINESPEVETVYWASMSAVNFSNGSKTYAGQVTAFEDGADISGAIDLHTRKGKDEITLARGEVVLSEKITILLGLSVGDEIDIAFADEEPHTVKIAAISENYVMHFAYMTDETYEDIFGEEPFFNTAYINFTEGLTDDEASAYAQRVLKNDAVLNTSFAKDTNREFADLVQSLNAIVLVLIVAAGALALVVLYNLTNINVTERIREIATIKVLGFYDGEVAAYIYRENIACAVVGIAVGLVLGVALHQFVVLTAEVDMVMFSRSVFGASYVYSALLTAFFTMLVNVALFFKLKKVDMVLSLKSVE